jgi:hypothetical protein
VIVEDLAHVYGAVVVGTTTLEADAFDSGSGIDEVTWYLDDEEIGKGTPYEYNFSMTPGQHVLTVQVSDLAGNSSTHQVELIAGPGPSLVAGELPTPEDGLPIEDPELPDGVPPTGLPEGVPPSGLPETTPPSGLPETTPPSGLPEDVPPAGLPEGVPPALPTLP